MAWVDWMRSRMISGVVAVVLTLPMGTPSAFAFARVKTDQMRAPGSAIGSDTTVSDLKSDITGTPKEPTKGSDLLAAAVV